MPGQSGSEPQLREFKTYSKKSNKKTSQLFLHGGGGGVGVSGLQLGGDSIRRQERRRSASTSPDPKPSRKFSRPSTSSPFTTELNASVTASATAKSPSKPKTAGSGTWIESPSRYSSFNFDFDPKSPEVPTTTSSSASHEPPPPPPPPVLPVHHQTQQKQQLYQLQQQSKRKKKALPYKRSTGVALVPVVVSSSSTGRSSAASQLLGLQRKKLSAFPGSKKKKSLDGPKLAATSYSSSSISSSSSSSSSSKPFSAKMGDTVSTVSAAFYGEDAKEENSVSTEVTADGAAAAAAAAATAVAACGPRCIECDERVATVHCVECDDNYCGVCFKFLHRKGKRAMHKKLPVSASVDGADATSLSSMPAEAEVLLAADMPKRLERNTPAWVAERARWIPVRLHMKERKYLRLVEAALSTCDYTTRIDVGTFKTPAHRTNQQIKGISAILTGLTMALDYENGKALTTDKDYGKYANVFGKIFEFARRYKVMNPEKMRGNYGKLMYLLQDAVQGSIHDDVLGFDCVKHIESVQERLESNGCGAVLRDKDIYIATMEIIPDGKPRHQIDREIKAKEAAQKRISRKYETRGFDRESILWCLYSISDNNSYVRSNAAPIGEMKCYLKKYFSSDRVEEGYSLAIASGAAGARLTHNHERHFNFVLQSLSLWHDIVDDMFHLWCLAEQDLLDTKRTYALKDTGQGLQRVQQSPRIASAMRLAIHHAQQELGSWVGSSVVHLGDTNVPNALTFIDKYTQVPRILAPIVQTLKRIPELAKNPKTAAYFDKAFGGVEKLRKDICYDFFRHGFDGSGADNFFDAGSCIDGRLTSAWNWCSALPDKPFFPVFRLAGWSSFD